jgi:hypothetical protein
MSILLTAMKKSTWISMRPNLRFWWKKTGFSKMMAARISNRRVRTKTRKKVEKMQKMWNRSKKLRKKIWNLPRRFPE